MTVQRFSYRTPSELYKPNCFNARIQIDFIGPLQTHKEDYACTVVDVHSGVMLAKAHKRPDAMATIYTLCCWWVRYAAPAITESDQYSNSQEMGPGDGCYVELPPSIQPTGSR
jgi:hypothetical protein